MTKLVTRNLAGFLSPGAADAKGFLYLIICKCSALEQLALSPAREIIDGMK